MSDGKVVVFKGRTNRLVVKLGINVSGDTITSEIRTEGKDLIAEWTVENETDGSDGVLILTLDDSVTAGIEYASGFMDLKRVSGGEPLAVFNKALEVEFRETYTQ